MYPLFQKFSLVPSSGCGAISSEGKCYKYFTAFAVMREEARLDCLLYGYDLATVSSAAENVLMFTLTSSIYCWIGLNDILIEGEFVEADGTKSTYAAWSYREPNQGTYANCVITAHSQGWFDEPCTRTCSCYFCSRYGKIF